MKLLTKQIFGWSVYDFANTVYAALLITVYFPLFLEKIGGNVLHFGIIISVSMLLAGLFVPFIGAVADVTQRKKFALFIFTLLCCLFTIIIGIFGLSLGLIWIIVFAILANFFYHASLDIYDSMLVNISTERNIGRISGIGTAAGYLGTILSVAVAYVIGFQLGFDTTRGIQAVFIVTAILFFGFSMITFVTMKDPSRTRIQKKHFKKAFTKVVSTLGSIKRYRYIWLFLLASFLYVDAANTAIIFLFLFARDQLGITLVQFLPLYVMMAISAGIGSLVFGKLSDKLGHKKTLLAVIFMWTTIIVALYLYTNLVTFFIVGIVGGALLGAVWTISRPLLVELAPKSKISELFGYQGLTEKFSGVFGPLLFSAVALYFDFRQALLVVIALFLVGGLILNFVKVRKR